MTEQQLNEKYGIPSESLTDIFIMPYPMELSWDRKVRTRKIKLHKDEGQSFIKACQEIVDTYGMDKVIEAGLNVFGGSFVIREMRNGTKLSTHSWGIAVDLDPDRNDLKGKNNNLLNYPEILDIFEKYGWNNLGRYKGYDSMHIQKFKP